MFYTFPSLVTCFALGLYALVSINVIRARERYHIKAPTIAGEPNFERIYRVQQNTLEQMALFLPALWMAAVFSMENLSGVIGSLWIAGRILYSYDYYQDASRIKYGFWISFGASLLLLAMGMLGVLVRLVS